MEQWIEGRSVEMRPNTIRSYRLMLRRYISEELRKMPLTGVTPLLLTEYYEGLIRSGGLRGKPLSVSTVKTLHAVLHKSFEDAMREDLLAVNPATRARVPKYDTLARGDFQLRMWTLEQVVHFLDVADDDEFVAIWRVAVLTGLSRAELLGLRWQDVDLERGRLQVSMALIPDPPGSPILRQGVRRPRILAIGPETIGLLVGQKSERTRRHRQGSADDLNLVFATREGDLIHPDKITKHFRRIVHESELPPIRFQDLRSTHTAALLRAGAPFHLVIQRLGQGDPWRAMRNFGQFIPPIDDEAAEVFERLLD